MNISDYDAHQHSYKGSRFNFHTVNSILLTFLVESHRPMQRKSNRPLMENNGPSIFEMVVITAFHGSSAPQKSSQPIYAAGCASS